MGYNQNTVVFNWRWMLRAQHVNIRRPYQFIHEWKIQRALAKYEGIVYFGHDTHHAKWTT